MKRAKKLYLLLGVLVVACLITFGISRYQTRQEEIQTSGETILEIPADSVDTLSWDVDGRSFSFRKETDGEDSDAESTWIYDEDDAFPVDKAKINSLLSCFESLSAAFIIEAPEDLGQYGLSDPACTITFSTADASYTVLLGDYSPMDSQRYVSIGDGNVYLVADDPMEEFDIELSDLLDDDDIPYLEDGNVTAMTFSGDINYQITYEENSPDTYRSEDVYFTEQNGRQVPLDSTRVGDYLHAVSFLFPDEYVTYNATEEDLASCGLDQPQLTFQVDYTTEDDDGNEVSNTFTMSISRDPAELAKAESSAADDTAGTDTAGSSQGGDEAQSEEITAYMRVGDSKIIYRLSGEDYQTLMAAGYNDLRHTEVLPADFADISQIDIALEGADYTITAQGDADDRTYFYQDQELDIADLQAAMQTLSADSFTDEQPSEKEEIHLTLHLDLEGDPSVELGLYRYDGSSCLAVVDGTPVCLVQRSYVVDLIEAVNAIVLN